MNGDETARTRLQELLLDDVAPPSELDRESMFERTFASEPGAGADLLTPDGLFDPAADPPPGMPDGGDLPGDDVTDDGYALLHDRDDDPDGWPDLTSAASDPVVPDTGPDEDADPDGTLDAGDQGP